MSAAEATAFVHKRNGGNNASANFIFANLNGTISAWNGGQTAFIQVTTPGARYTGLAINQAQTQLYAANSAGPGSVNVFNSAFAQVGAYSPGRIHCAVSPNQNRQVALRRRMAA
jgi:DNA-binding beta-propeller fold protein YncE